jgi:hypothetical protein
MDYQARYLKFIDINDKNTLYNYFKYVEVQITPYVKTDYLFDNDINIIIKLNTLHEWLLNNSNTHNINIAIIYTNNNVYEIPNIIENDLEYMVNDSSFIKRETFTSDFTFNKTMHEIIRNPYNYGVSKSLKDRLTDPKAITDNIGKTRHSRYLPEFMKHIDDDILT